MRRMFFRAVHSLMTGPTLLLVMGVTRLLNLRAWVACQALLCPRCFNRPRQDDCPVCLGWASGGPADRPWQVGHPPSTWMARWVASTLGELQPLTGYEEDADAEGWKEPPADGYGEGNDGFR